MAESFAVGALFAPMVQLGRYTIATKVLTSYCIKSRNEVGSFEGMTLGNWVQIAFREGSP